jgi:hypothetical protein
VSRGAKQGEGACNRMAGRRGWRRISTAVNKQLPPALTAFAPSTPGSDALIRGAEVELPKSGGPSRALVVPGAATLNVIGNGCVHMSWGRSPNR